MLPTRLVWKAFAASLIAGGFMAVPATADEALLADNCGACHAADADGQLSRIAGQRKSPEGWLMTIVRMRVVHGIEMTDSAQADLVTYLSETNGLAPSETEGYRYILERDPSIIEEPPAELAEMCARCHSAARVALQRRTPEEWRIHMDFHVGQYPTIEYQALGRDREWYKIAVEETTPWLAENFPFETEAWTAWQAADKPDPTGDWDVVVRLPEAGPATGMMVVSGASAPYTISGNVTTNDGTSHSLSGEANLYTGFEWRGSVTIDDVDYSQVLALSEDGDTLSGRQFVADADEIGGRFEAVRSGSDAELAGIDRMVDGDVDSIRIEPPFAIARVGGGGGSTPPVKALFRAIGYANGADGEAGTDDDVRLGEVAADWSVKAFDEVAEQMEDVAYAGEMDASLGIFTPNVAGPNPDRPFSTNNAGNLTVVADHGGKTAEAQLIVTVQRWNDPPIR